MVCVFAKDTLPLGREITLEDVTHEYMCFRLALLHSTIYLYFLYRSPLSQNSAIFGAIFNSIDLALSRHPTAEIMVFGDFNVHHKEWLVHSHSTDTSGVSAFNFALSQDLTQIISAPTRIPDRANDNRYLLDLFLCSNPNACRSSILAPIGNSDHANIAVQVSCAQSTTSSHPYHRTVLQYGSADWDGLRSFLGDVPWNSVFCL